MYRKILIATDGSDESQRAARHAIALCKAFGCPAVALFVLDTRLFPGAHPIYAESLAPQYFTLVEELRKAGERALAEVTEEGARHAVSVKGEMREGIPAATIAATARDLGTDLIVLGTHGRTGLKAVLLGSTAQAVVHGSEVPVLLVR